MNKINLIGISGRKGVGKDTVGLIIQYLIFKSKFNKTGIERLSEFYKHKDALNLKDNYKIVKFADKLKDIVCLLIGCTREQLEDEEFKEKELGKEWWLYEYWVVHSFIEILKRVPYNKYDSNLYDDDDDVKCTLVRLTPRKLLQLLDTECGRQIIHPNIWVNALFADYMPIKDNLLEGEVRKVREEDLIYPNWIITDVRFPNEAQAIKDRGGIVIRVNRYEDELTKCLNNPTYFYENYVRVEDQAPPLRDVDKNFISEYMTNNNLIQNEHLSETALDSYTDWDYIIDNNGSIDNLINKVQAILELKENKMYVKLKSITPNIETTIVEIARVSSTRKDKSEDPAGLIKYCIKNKHWSPFEHGFITMEIKTSKAIGIQLLRHRSFTFQEFSQRYAKVTEIEPIEIREQAVKNRQSSKDIINPLVNYDLQTVSGLVHTTNAKEAIEDYIKSGLELYNSLIENGVAKECARMILPMATSTTIYMTGTVRSWIHLLDIRDDKHAQLEIQLIAKEMKKIMIEQCPIISKARGWVK